jgi:putative hydrolase of the HAD superfamily
MKTILIDADGVLLKKQPYFSIRISQEYNVPYELMEPFYLNELKKCQIAAADMKEELAKYLPKWNWTKSADEFMQYWFTTDVIPDQDVLAVVDTLRQQGAKCYLASEQEKYRSSHIWNIANLKNRLDGSFFTHDVGALKSTPEYFHRILATLNLKPEEVMFWDDDQKNVDVAKNAGIDARFYSNLEEFKQATATL